jgi:hypothetical protein
LLLLAIFVKAVGEFCTWLEAHGVPSIAGIGSVHIATYVERYAGEGGHDRQPGLNPHHSAL